MDRRAVVAVTGKERRSERMAQLRRLIGAQPDAGLRSSLVAELEALKAEAAWWETFERERREDERRELEGGL